MGGKTILNWPAHFFKYGDAGQKWRFSMKMVKKVLIGAVALAAILTLASCGKKNDTNKAIKGSGDNWTVDYTNDADSNYRAYRSTGLKHAGAIVKVTFNKGADAKNSKMGVIFGLEEKDGKSDFHIIGIAPDGTYYVSTYKNIEDIQGDNFGATVDAATGPSEKEIVKLSAGKKVTLKEDSNGNKYTYIVYIADKSGVYYYSILDLTDDEIADFDTAKGEFKTEATEEKVATASSFGIIASAFTPVATINDLPQHQISMYAMIQPGATLSGSWKVAAKFKEADDIE